jgi:probable addiction module antidote protein
MTAKTPKKVSRPSSRKVSPIADGDFKSDLLVRLKDREYAAEYLTAALEESESVFLLAVRDVAQAHGGLRSVSKATSLNRESLYSMLSEDGNPRLSSLTSVLDTLGIRLQFAPA